MHVRKRLNMQILDAYCRNQSTFTHLLAHMLNFRNTNFQTETSQNRKLFYIHVRFFFLSILKQVVWREKHWQSRDDRRQDWS